MNCSAVCQWSHYLFITVPLSSFTLPAEVPWHGSCISWAEQPFSSLVQTLWNHARLDRRFCTSSALTLCNFFFFSFFLLCVVLGSKHKNFHAFCIQTILPLDFASYSSKPCTWLNIPSSSFLFILNIIIKTVEVSSTLIFKAFMPFSSVSRVLFPEISLTFAAFELTSARLFFFNGGIISPGYCLEFFCTRE